MAGFERSDLVLCFKINMITQRMHPEKSAFDKVFCLLVIYRGVMAGFERSDLVLCFKINMITQRMHPEKSAFDKV